MPTRILDSVSAEPAELLDGLGWPVERAIESIQVEVVRAATPEHPRERIRLSLGARAIEAEVDYSDREPHQIGSIRLQCAIAFSEAGQRGLLVHGAGLALPDRGAVVALAPSGGGKSTLSNLSTRFVGLSDETVLLCPGPTPSISATPLRSSSEKVPAPRTDPLRALLFLEKSLEPHFEPLPASAALKLLLAQGYKLPAELAPTAQLFKRAAQLVAQVPAYRFAFPKSPAGQELLLRLFDEKLDPKDP